MLAIALLVLAACATTGSPINEDSVGRIERGVTTEREIRKWFGDPASVRKTGSGHRSWGYRYEEKTRRDTGTLTKIGRSVASIFGARVFLPPVDVAYENRVRHRLVVYFDQGGTVVNYAYEREELPTKKVY